MSPVNSIPYVLSEIFTQLSMGTWIIIVFSLYIVIQFVLLGKNLQPWRILQLICTTLFGYFTDFTNFLAGLFLPNPAEMQLSPVLAYGIQLSGSSRGTSRKRLRRCSGRSSIIWSFWWIRMRRNGLPTNAAFPGK